MGQGRSWRSRYLQCVFRPYSPGAVMSDGADGLSIAGIVGGVTTAMGLLGTGVWRLITRADRKAERLQAKEEAQVAKLEARVAALEEDNRKIWLALSYVVPALHAHDPKSPALKAVAQILGDAFPVPADMTEKLSKIG